MDKRIDLLIYLLDHQYKIQSLVAYHLGGKKVKDCRLAPIGEWEHGSHNICLPVSNKGRQGHGGERVIIRFPLSYKLGEDLFPVTLLKNSDQKLPHIFGSVRIVLKFQSLIYWVLPLKAINM